MAMDIQSQSANLALPTNQQASMLKRSADKPVATAKQDAAVEVAKQPSMSAQAIEVKEKTSNSVELPKANIQEAVNKLQDYVDKYNRDLKFSVDDDTGRTVVRLLDSDDNVVKQYPSEEILSLISNLEQNKGLFIDQA
ncbi:MAG TPA: flagellar protein FlaG [Gammaproteobacteria bacterium]|nr:flagellar protein FlaG [Gammaproteobacteria bacterium]